MVTGKVTGLLDPDIIDHLVAVTVAAAASTFPRIGVCTKEEADDLATNAMRSAFSSVPISGTVVIGEGERDKAPMLFIGEEVGSGGPEMDIAVDPLEGTACVANMLPNATSVMALGPRGTLLHCPDSGMHKVVVGPDIGPVVHLDQTPEERVDAVCVTLKRPPEEIRVALLDRPRHHALRDRLQAKGCQVIMFPEGDVAWAISTCLVEPPVEMLMGLGGGPEGVIAAAAVKALGGHMEGMMDFMGDEEERARGMGFDHMGRILTLSDMVGGDAIFIGSGIIEGPLLGGIVKEGEDLLVPSVVIQTGSGTVDRRESRVNFPSRV